MLDGTLLDVAIGMLLIFLVSSLIASAVVEAIGGFLHRRSKHLWDTLDLLLGNTSTADGDIRSIVHELYSQPFVTGLVRPTDRAQFDPALGTPRNGVPMRAKPPKPVRERAVVATRAVEDEELLRRYYGPIHLDAGNFTNALLAVLRPQGGLDEALATLHTLRELLDRQTGTDVAVADLDASLKDLRSAAESIKARNVTDAIDQLRSAGERVDLDRVRGVVGDAESALIAFFTGDPTREQLVSALGVVPHDLRMKLLAVLNEAGEGIVEIRAGIENWYERTMTAASSWYRKQTRWFLFIAGVIMAVSFNVDAVGAATTLYRDEASREALVSLADDVSSITCDNSAVSAADDAETATAVLDLECVKDELGGALALPIGWGGIETTFWAWVLRVLGWIAIAGSVTVGAPFWFDLLGRALRLRGKSDGQAV